MTSQQNPLGRIVLAERRVREAADWWNAVDLSAIDRCISTLECSAADMRDATEILERSSTESESLIRSKVLDLKKAVFRLERLVGASAAFLRGAPGPAREDSGFYQAGGAICRTAPAPETRGMQV